MADVRLTATNPEDSSVVPVACDAAGRLLLEEPQVVEGPPGPPGPQGDPGQDGQDGDPFSGNFAGDVSFGGSASVANDVVIGKPISTLTSLRGVRIESGGTYNYLISNDVQAGGGTSTCYQHLLNGDQTLALNADGSASFSGSVKGPTIFADSGISNRFTKLDSNGNPSMLIRDSEPGRDAGIKWSQRNAANTANLFSKLNNDTLGLSYYHNVGSDFTGSETPQFILGSDGGFNLGGTLPLEPNISLNADGSAEFAGDVMVSDANSVTSTTTGGTYIADYGQVVVNSVSETPSSDRVFLGKSKNVTTSEINADGSVSYASRKAGFTAEGYLWCTTRRGDTVILDFTSNGAGQWVEYTPTTRIEDIRDNLNAIRGDTGEMPADTP